MARHHVDFFDEKWHWPAEKFDLDMTALTGTLFDKFNTHATPLQDLNAFFYDVRDVSQQASTTDEFYTELKNRREQRKMELEESLCRLALRLAGDPDLLPKGSWGPAICFLNSRSLDATIAFLSSLAEKEPSAMEPLSTRPIKSSARPNMTGKGKVQAKPSATRRKKEGRVNKPSPGQTRYNLRAPK